MTVADPVIRDLIRDERERLLGYLAREEGRAEDLRIRLRPLELHIAELKAELAALDGYDPDPTGPEHRTGE